MMANKETLTVVNAPMFSKTQIISAEKYTDRRDLLNVLLTEDKQYTFAEVDAAINDFMKKEVK